jgi:hypothetical protein
MIGPGQLPFRLRDIGTAAQQFGRQRLRYRRFAQGGQPNAAPDLAGKIARQHAQSVFLPGNALFDRRDDLRGRLVFGFGLRQFQPRGIAGVGPAPDQAQRLFARGERRPRHLAGHRARAA